MADTGGDRARRGDRHHVAGERLSAFLDDELHDTEALELTRHVLGCDRCRDELDALRTTRAALRDLAVRPAATGPPEGRERRWRQRGGRVRRLVRSSTVVLAVAVVGIVSYVAGDTGQVVPPVDTFLLDHLAHTGEGPVPPPIGGPAR